MSHELDLTLTRNLATESASRAANLRSRTARNRLLGLAAVIGAGGLAAAATVWAYNQRQDPALIAKTIEETQNWSPLRPPARDYANESQGHLGVFRISHPFSSEVRVMRSIAISPQSTRILLPSC